MDTKTEVVRIRRKKTGEIVQDCDVYIGRKMTMGGWNLPQSKWANPFPVKKEAERADALRKYEEWIRTQPQLMASLEELHGKRLGCWCKPKACHGDILVRLMEEKFVERFKRLTGGDGHVRSLTSTVQTGDIHASRYAQKGTIGMLLSDEDLPVVFPKTGDLIMMAIPCDEDQSQ